MAALRAQAVTEQDVIDALRKLDPIWVELFPAEQQRIVQPLVQEVVVNADGLNADASYVGRLTPVTRLGQDGTAARAFLRAAMAAFSWARASRTRSAPAWRRFLLRRCCLVVPWPKRP